MSVLSDPNFEASLHVRSHRAKRPVFFAVVLPVFAKVFRILLRIALLGGILYYLNLRWDFFSEILLNIPVFRPDVLGSLLL